MNERRSPAVQAALDEMGFMTHEEARAAEEEMERRDVNLVSLEGTVKGNPVGPTDPPKGKIRWARFVLVTFGRRDATIPIVAFGDTAGEVLSMARDGERLQVAGEVSTEAMQGVKGPWIKVSIVARSIARVRG